MIETNKIRFFYSIICGIIIISRNRSGKIIRERK